MDVVDVVDVVEVAVVVEGSHGVVMLVVVGVMKMLEDVGVMKILVEVVDGVKKRLDVVEVEGVKNKLEVEEVDGVKNMLEVEEVDGVKNMLEVVEVDGVKKRLEVEEVDVVEVTGVVGFPGVATLDEVDVDPAVGELMGEPGLEDEVEVASPMGTSQTSSSRISEPLVTLDLGNKPPPAQ